MDLFTMLYDFKHIFARPDLANVNRRALLATYFRLNWRMSTNRDSNSIRVLDFDVQYLDASTLKALYQDIFVKRLYWSILDTKEPIIVDCGSNIGMSILFFKSLYPKARVFGFEPHPRLYHILKSNVENNHLEHVSIFQKALSDATGTVDFFVNDSENPGSLNMGFMQREATARPILVEADLLSNYIGDMNVDLVKLDIEGAEEQVLHDLHAHNKLKNVRYIVCEFHHHIDRGVDRLSNVLRILEESGFGYQLSAYSNLPPKIGSYQDVIVYAFNKAPSHGVTRSG